MSDLIRIAPGNTICHAHWLQLEQADMSGVVFSLWLIRAAWAQQDDLLGDWRDDMAFWISYQRPLCESLPPEAVERALRKAATKPAEVKSKKRLVAVPRSPIFVDMDE